MHCVLIHFLLYSNSIKTVIVISRDSPGRFSGLIYVGLGAIDMKKNIEHTDSASWKATDEST